MYRYKLIEKISEKSKRAEGVRKVKESVRRAYDEGIRSMVNRDNSGGIQY